MLILSKCSKLFLVTELPYHGYLIQLLFYSLVSQIADKKFIFIKYQSEYIHQKLLLLFDWSSSFSSSKSFNPTNSVGLDARTQKHGPIIIS